MKSNLILHIDDIGSSKNGNIAAFEMFENGSATSGSIMVPCESFEDAVKIYKKSSFNDLGVHLTLTSERDENINKWGPTLLPEEVPSLVDSNGYFHSTIDQFFKNASEVDIIKECSNQIIKALNSGIDVTHIDSHMGVLLHKKFFNAYIFLSNKFKIQPFIVYPKVTDSDGYRFYGCDKIIEGLDKSKFKVFDHYDRDSLYTGDDFDLYQDNRINNIKVGTTYFLLHVLNSNENTSLPDKMSRIAEYKYFNNPKIDLLLMQKGINKISVRDFIGKL